ncbi:MarC family protein [Elioraea sp.]|uniref:MarC family protein n=1 Tax=Elioraea sp. TaxID=2185103 RepID=UPI0025B7F7CA|nr:MarC family protein [Elioraea sp.]
MPRSAMLDAFLYALVALLVIFDPPGTAAIFIAITPRDTDAERREQAVRAVGISFVVLAGFAIGGEWLMRAMGVTLPAFQVAGGILLFLLATDMVMVRDSGLRRTTERETAEAEAQESDITVFPLAIPLIAGPGAMTTMVLLRGQAGDDWGLLAALAAALGVALAVTLVSLLAAKQLVRMLGETGTNVIGRVLGVVVAALAAQITLDGVRAILA